MQFSDRKAQSRDGILESAAPGIEMDYEEILKKIGFGKTQWILLLISGFLTLTSMAAQISPGILSIASQCEFEMDQAQKGLMMAAPVAGIFLSTYFWGYLSDAFGRRTVLIYGTFATNLLQLFSMLMTNIWAFNIINLLQGISLGGVSAAIYAYLSEFNTAQHRAVVINYSTMFVSIASIYVPATAWLVLSADADWSLTIYEGFVFRPWRLLIIFNILPGFIGTLMLLPFPESPKLLLAQHKENEALAALDWICKFNTGRSMEWVLKTDDFKLKPEVLGDDDVLSNECGLGILMTIWRATLPLFHRPHCVNFIISAMAVFGLFFSSTGMHIWYPEIVKRSSGDVSGKSSTVCEILDSSFARQALNSTLTENALCDDSISTQTYIDNMIVGCAFLTGFTIQGTLLNPLGRKNVLLAALIISGFSGILLHFVTNATAVLILFCLYIVMPGLSISIMVGSVVDLVPTNLRGKAVSLCFTMGRLGMIVALNMIGGMLEPLCNTTFAIFTCSMLVCALLVHFLPI